METGSFATSLEEIARQVDQRRSGIARWLSPARITTTHNFWHGKVKDAPEGTGFRPNGALFIVSFMVGCVVLIGVTSGLEDRTAFGVVCGFVATGAAFAYLMLRKRNSRPLLYLDFTGIRIDDRLVPWASLRETAILTYRQGKSTRRHLVLWYQNGTYELIDLFWFNSFSFFGIASKLSSYIEYYRGQRQPS